MYKKKLPNSGATALPRTFDDLKPWEGNPRTIAPDNDARLARSLAVYGDLANITYNRVTGHLVGGHQRVRNLKQQHGQLALVAADGRPASELKRDEGVDYLYVETPTGERFPVRVVAWSPEKERAANVAANSTDVTGQFDWEALSQLLQSAKVDDDLDAFMLAEGTTQPLLLAGWDKDDAGDVNDPEFGGTKQEFGEHKKIEFTCEQWRRVASCMEQCPGDSEEDNAAAIVRLCEAAVQEVE